MQEIETRVGKVKVVKTTWSKADIWEHIKLRWSIGRNHSRLKPGVYAVGHPTPDSDVFVTANYKLSFNHLRKALHGLSAWILVLDTEGVNVWCAAGKGTFGTRELTYRVKAHQIEKLVNHKRLIVPQLGATGISAHEVMNFTGFKVIYGPVRASDIPSFILHNYKSTPQMRRVTFPLWERTKLIPVELVYGKYYLILVPLLFLFFAGFNSRGYSLSNALNIGGKSVFNLLVAYLAGCVATPILLPYIPFKRFALKGLIIGWLFSILLFIYNFIEYSWIDSAAWLLIIGSISSFLAMNFTGSSTFTSLSGVKKEMKVMLPAQIAAASIGCVLWVVSLFV